jgi:hypothetical protein
MMSNERLAALRQAIEGLRRRHVTVGAPDPSLRLPGEMGQVPAAVRLLTCKTACWCGADAHNARVDEALRLAGEIELASLRKFQEDRNNTIQDRGKARSVCRHSGAPVARSSFVECSCGWHGLVENGRVPTHAPGPPAPALERIDDDHWRLPSGLELCLPEEPRPDRWWTLPEGKASLTSADRRAIAAHRQEQWRKWGEGAWRGYSID